MEFHQISVEFVTHVHNSSHTLTHTHTHIPFGAHIPAASLNSDRVSPFATAVPVITPNSVQSRTHAGRLHSTLRGQTLCPLRNKACQLCVFPSVFQEYFFLKIQCNSLNILNVDVDVDNHLALRNIFLDLNWSQVAIPTGGQIDLNLEGLAGSPKNRQKPQENQHLFGL